MSHSSAAARLQEIVYVFPSHSECEKRWNRTFGALLSGIPRYTGSVISPLPPQSLPSISFRTADVRLPSIFLRTAASIEAAAGKVSISSKDMPPAAAGLLDREDEASGAVSEDVPGDASSVDHTGPLSMTVLYSLLNGHIADLDHAGANLPSRDMKEEQWEALMRSLSRITNLYRYPGEAWPFIIPATEQEFRDDISELHAVRMPKFEWVYDGYASLPVFQFALVTDFTRAELEARFPAPSGFSIPGLESIFRSVHVDSPWREALSIRVDLYYKRQQEAPTDWETGAWLVQEGGRING